MKSDANVGCFDSGLERGLVTAIRLWAGRSPWRLGQLWRWRRAFRKTCRRRADLFQREGLLVPPMLMLSPTMHCNLSSSGCYSRNYPRDGEMTLSEIGDLFGQAEELGVFFLVLTGGEPLLRDGLMDLVKGHGNLVFLLFINGSMVDAKWASAVARLGNVVPVLSIEGNQEETDARRGPGTYKQVAKAMAVLGEASAFFGFSTMVTRQNLHTVGQGDFIDEMGARGCRVGFLTDYVPLGSRVELDRVPTEEEQIWLRARLTEIKQRAPVFLVRLPDDEYAATGSCMAAGRGFLHVNAQGYVEPCPFSHLASDTIREKPFREILNAPLFSHIRAHPDVLTKPHEGCALFTYREELEGMAGALGAFGAEGCF
ncbi:MAG: radical SAM protein [Candidatus Latescibacterota bacterium]